MTEREHLVTGSSPADAPRSTLFARLRQMLAAQLVTRKAAFYADKRCGYGRLRQLRIRFGCRVLGHRFGDPIEGIRRCRNGCGGMQRG